MPCTATERLETGTAMAHSLREIAGAEGAAGVEGAAARQAAGAGSWITTSSWSMITCGRAKPVGAGANAALGTATSVDRRCAAGVDDDAVEGRRRDFAGWRGLVRRPMSAAVPRSATAGAAAAPGSAPWRAARDACWRLLVLAHVGGRAAPPRAPSHPPVAHGAAERAEVWRLGLAGDFLGKPGVVAETYRRGQGRAGRRFSSSSSASRATCGRGRRRQALLPRLLLPGARAGAPGCRLLRPPPISCRGRGLVLFLRLGAPERRAAHDRSAAPRPPRPASLPPAERGQQRGAGQRPWASATGARGRRGAARAAMRRRKLIAATRCGARPLRSRRIIAA